MHYISNQKEYTSKATEYVVRVTNSLGKCVLVNKIYKNFPLRVRGCEFPTNMMLLTFNEFDVILDMN